MKNVVIDASVIAKWFLSQEEKNLNIALKIRQDFLSQVISISLPILAFYEVNNLLKTACQSLKIDPGQAKVAYDGFLELAFTIYTSGELFQATLEKAQEVDISSYDAAYLALAEALKSPFYTADEKLFSKASPNSKYIKRLEDYNL